LIAFLECLTPKALKLDSKGNLLKEHVDAQVEPLLIMEDPRGNVFWGVLSFSSWEISFGAHQGTLRKGQMLTQKTIKRTK